MQKAKQYDWKDSNLALFGSDTEKKVKKESAESEPAWKGAGQKVGIQIWRIVKFKVTKWEEEEYGKFYSGDSYIILNTYKEEDSDELQYDVHFWIGKYSTQDEYGTAAYKTVELDTLLEDKPIQHREVMNHESDLFKTYFDSLTLLKGGADTGFRRVLPEEYQTRLFHVVGERKQIAVKEIPAKKGNINEEDVFILDKGLQLYQYNGETCNKDEKFRATQYVQQIKSERSGKPKVEILEGGSTSKSHPFFQALKEGTSKKDKAEEDTSPPAMIKVSDSSGKMKTEVVLEGSLDRSKLGSDDVFLVDSGKDMFVWLGKNATVDERRNGMSYAHNYLQETSHPFIPVTVISEGKKSANFDKIF